METNRQKTQKPTKTVQTRMANTQKTTTNNTTKQVKT